MAATPRSKARTTGAATKHAQGRRTPGKARGGPKLPTAMAIDPARRWTPGGWKGVASMVLADDGRMVAGRSGKASVCAWAPDGRLAWSTDLEFDGDDLSVRIQLVGDQVIAHVAYGTRAFFLDAATGSVQRTIGLVPHTRTMRVAPDGTRFVMRAGQQALIFGLPVLSHLATLEEYCNEESIAFSPDGRHLAINGHEVHVYDAASAAHVATFEPPDAPNVMTFATDGTLLLGDAESRVSCYAVTGERRWEIDAAPERKKKVTITALAASRSHLAVAREDGVVTLFDDRRKVIATWRGHQVKLAEGSTLPGVALTRDGSSVWVSGGPSGGPIGPVRYAIS